MKKTYWLKKMEKVQIALTVVAILAAVGKIADESQKVQAEIKAEKAVQASKDNAPAQVIIPVKNRIPVPPVVARNNGNYMPVAANSPMVANPPQALVPNSRMTPSNFIKTPYVSFKEIQHSPAKKMALQQQKKRLQLAKALPAKKRIAEKPKFVSGRKPSSKKPRLIAKRGIASVSTKKVKKPIAITFDESGSYQ